MSLRGGSRQLAIVAIAAVAVCAAMLSGCAPSGSFPGETRNQVEVSFPKPTPTSDPTPVVGQPVSEGTQLPDGWRSYALPDGTHVAVDPNAPLPKAVWDDAQSRHSQIPIPEDRGVTDNEGNGVSIAMANELSNALRREIGKRTLVITSVIALTIDDPRITTRYIVNTASPAASSNGIGYDSSSIDATVTYFQSWIDAQPDAANWLLVY